MYDMAIEIIDSLKNGNVLLIDEFDKDRVRNNTNFSKWYLDGRFKAISLLDYDKFNLWND